MHPDSLAAELLAAALAVAAAVALAVFWTSSRGWRRVLLRTTAVIVCLATTSATGLIWVNRQVDSYPTWASLLGSNDEPLAVVTSRPAGGQLTSLTVAGRASGLTLPMYAYLPPGYAENRATRFPVIEALHGYPASPLQWLNKLDVVAVLDREIAAGRMSPTIVLFPYQTPDPMLDTECTNLVGGPQAETFLTVDVPAAARTSFRVRTEASAWGLIGYSAGGYCAADLLLRHPFEYNAAASLSGYAEPGIRVGDGTEHTSYNAVWRLTHLPVPAVALYLSGVRTDRLWLRDTLAMTRAATSTPLSLTTVWVDGGGHNVRTWRAMQAPAFDWLSTWLGRPTTTNVSNVVVGRWP